MNIKLSIVFFVIYAISAQASEVDNYHQRYTSLKDSTELINQHSNKLFDSVLEKTNNSELSCSEKLLYKNLRKEFHNDLEGEFNKYISYSNELERVKLKTSDSIYGDFSIRDSVILGLISKHIKESLASSINVQGHFIGIDKFQHFAGSGFDYFENYYIKNKSINSTLNIGLRAEDGILGSYSTGVKSFGDMTAEFNGMRFWNHILSKNPDVLGIELGPYVKCENNHWVKIKAIDFSQYVDDAWDEGVNCSNFRTIKMLNKVKKSIKELEERSGDNYTCPIKKESSLELIKKYGKFSNQLINTTWGTVK